MVQYENFRRLLNEELGVDPDPEITVFYEEVLSEASASARTLAAPRHNLPPNLTPFIGRTSEYESIAASLIDDDVRLLSLVGPGGSGKTRLAIEAARAQIDHFTNGVFLVPLSQLQSVAPLASS